MNRNFLIAIVIAAAALVAYFILSSPSPTDTPTGNTGAGAGTGTGTGAGNSANNPLSQLLSGVITNNGPDIGLSEQPIEIGWVTNPTLGVVKIYGSLSDVSNHKYYVIVNTGEKVMPGTEKYSAIRSWITANGKSLLGIKATV